MYSKQKAPAMRKQGPYQPTNRKLAITYYAVGYFMDNFFFVIMSVAELLLIDH